MIEINLIPDVKQELIRAQQVRTTVISIATFLAIGFGAAVVILAMYVFGAQAYMNNDAQGKIKSKFDKLQNVQDLDKALTLQKQLQAISAQHEAASVNSRLFDILATVIPQGTVIKSTKLSVPDKTITIEGETDGYNSLDALKKTILATKFEYKEDGTNDAKSVALATTITDGDRSFGQGQDGSQVLRFSFSFQYPAELLERTSLNGVIHAPAVKNATDSNLNIPASIFKSNGGGN